MTLLLFRDYCIGGRNVPHSRFWNSNPWLAEMYMVDYAGILVSPAILADSCAHGSVYLGWNVYLFICMGLDMNTPLVLNEYRGVGRGENHTETM